MKRFLVRFIRRNRNTLFFKQVNRISSALSRILNCEDDVGDFLRNGEYNLIKLLATEDCNGMLFFDVGANRGDCAQAWMHLTEMSRVYCFEIVRPTYEKLSDRFQGNLRASCYPFGLSDTNMETVVSYIPESDSGSSLNVLPWQHEMKELPALLKTGDSFVAESDINEIFFLKIDTEGHELNVLRGFLSLIKKQKIKCIQFEYGYTYIQNRYFLKDVYELLESAGYDLGRIYPEGVNFKEYDIFRDENFRMKNYFATCDPDIRKKVSWPR